MTKAELMAEIDRLRQLLEARGDGGSGSEVQPGKKQPEIELRSGSAQAVLLVQGEALLFANAACGHLLGYGDAEEMLDVGAVSALLGATNGARLSAAGAPAEIYLEVDERAGGKGATRLKASMVEVVSGGAPAKLVMLAAATETERGHRRGRDSEMRFRSFVENMRNIIFCHGAAGDAKYGYDEGGVSVYGQNAPALAGTVLDGKANLEHWFEIIHPEDQAAYREVERKRKTEGRDYTLEFRFYHPETGELRWAQECGWVVDDPETGKRYLDSYILDITDRKQAELALIESERRFRDFAEAASDWFWEMDQNMRFTYLSDRIRDASGISPEDHYGKTREEVGIPEDDPEKWAQHRAVLNARQPFRDFTFWRRGPGGRVSHIKTSGKPVFDDGGAFKGYRGVGTEITAELKAHEALQASESRLKAIIDNAPLLIALKDLDGRCMLANRHYASLYGLAEDEVIGKTVHELFDADEAEPFWQHERRVLASGEAIQEEFLNKTKDGERTLLETKFPIRSEHGEIVGLGFIGADITARKRAEERFRQYFDLPLVGTAITAPDKRWLEVNDRLCEMLGYRREELLRLTWEDVTHPDDLELSLSHYDAAFNRETDLCSFEKRYIRKDGQVILAAISTQCVRRPDGSPDYFITLLQDVTERGRAAQALRDSEERFRDIAEISSDWFWEMDEDLRFSYFSERLTDVTGLDPADILGKTRAEIGRGSVAEEKWRKHLQDLDERRPFRDFRYAYKGEDGRAQRWSISGTPIFDDHGNFRGYRGTGTDVTAEEEAFDAQRTAMEHAQAASRAKSEFLANMSHELRTPLNAIIGFSEMMKGELLGPLGDDNYRQYAHDIHESGSHLLSLINDILDLSKIEAGKFELEEATIDIGRSIAASVRLIRPRAEEAGLKLMIDVSPGLPALSADERALKQILLNLLSNAVKFTPRGGTVTVAASVDADGRPSISVSDSGIGMAEDELATAMSSFGQIDSTYTRQHQGTGLGLPLVKALVELHGGQFQLDSAPGKGTTATARLPAARIVRQSDQETA
ncbi:MAG: PAS domain S-box protein [Alphaproteobacteria bacterium]|nr:PAS domain S-box protein [Alphaproteobacteria bacterium]